MDEPSTEVPEQRSAPRVGVVTADRLRAHGLTTILADYGLWQVELIAWEELPVASPLAALLIDHMSLGWLLAALERVLHERPGTPVLLMAPALPLEEVQQVIAAGAKGYLSASAGERELCMAVEVVLDGSVWAPRKVMARLIEATRGQPSAAPALLSEQLTAKEREVLELLMQGHTNRLIGDSMGIEEVTVKAHLGRMLRKAGVTNRVELTLRGLQERRLDD